MKHYIYILIFVLTLTACNQKRRYSNEKQTETITSNKIFDSLQENKQELTSKRITFKNIIEVIQDKKHNAWLGFKDSSASLALHFNLGCKDTICASYSPECWLIYPYKVNNNKIIVYWSNFMDTKYNFDIVKAVHRIDKKYLGKPFMVLELVNDTTLKATYLLPELVKKINNSSKVQTFFPDRYVVSQEFYL